MNRAVFLDRDGTINEDRGYIQDTSDFIFEHRSIDAIRLLNRAGFKVVVISNQAGIALGHCTIEAVDRLHKWVSDQLAVYEAVVDGFYYCPHHPEGQGVYRKVCECRKPAPGLLLQAAADFSIDLAASWMVGDHQSDIKAAQAAGVKPVFILTGHGIHELPRVADSVLKADTLYQAVTEHILKNQFF